MTAILPSAGAVAPRPWWRRRAGALGAALLVQVPAALLLARAVPPPWNTGAPMALALAVFFTYHPDWRARRWRRGALAQFGVLLALGLLVVGAAARLGWWQ